MWRKEAFKDYATVVRLSNQQFDVPVMKCRKWY